MSDPMKDMVRHYDWKIVAKGGASIFGRPPGSGDLGIADGRTNKPLPAMTVEDRRHYEKARAIIGPIQARKHIPKPGRIVGGIMGKLGGFMDDLP